MIKPRQQMEPQTHKLRRVAYISSRIQHLRSMSTAAYPFSQGIVLLVRRTLAQEKHVQALPYSFEVRVVG